MVGHRIFTYFDCFAYLGLIMESGGIAKVTNIEESNKRTLDAFDQAILDHKNRKKIEIPECKYSLGKLCFMLLYPPPVVLHNCSNFRFFPFCHLIQSSFLSKVQYVFKKSVFL